MDEEEQAPSNLITLGKYYFSLNANRHCPERLNAPQTFVKDIIHNALASAINKSDLFFDVSHKSLSATVSGQLLYKEDVFSITRAFRLQVFFDKKGFYLAVLANQRLYNRIRLPEVLELLGENSLSFPQNALCFAGDGDEAKWRDGKILSINADFCFVSIPSIRPSEITLPIHRVIPKLDTVMIKRLAFLKNSHANIEQLLKRLRSGEDNNEGTSTAKASQEILEKYIAPLFPLLIGDLSVSISQSTCSPSDIEFNEIRQTFKCMSKLGGRPQVFDSILRGLQSISFEQAKSHPVALFATPQTVSQIKHLVASLNFPPDIVGEFKGMPKHFGIELEPLNDGPYIVNNVEEYIERVRELTLSPDRLKRSALALIALSQEDETFQKPIPLYYRLKALLARTGHPSQVVDRDTLTNKYARWNLALNIAAKLGAIPWTLADSAPLKPVDLFLGFSFSSIHSASIGQSRNIAYVNVFDGSGTWQVFCADGTIFSFEERHKIFPKIASDAVRTATDNPKALRLIEVHYNKRFGHSERQAIAQGIHSQAPDASIVFVSITDEHPVRFFNPASVQNSAPRGTVLNLGSGTTFVQTINADKWSGLPRPLRLQIFNDFAYSTKDALDVSKRILALSRLNWRSVRDNSSLPVTILYSSLVARLTNYFSQTDWQEIDHSLKSTPWFL